MSTESRQSTQFVVWGRVGSVVFWWMSRSVGYLASLWWWAFVRGFVGFGSVVSVFSGEVSVSL